MRRMSREERRRFQRDVAGLRPLSELPRFDVADDDLDVRGWIVMASDGVVIGTVRDLLADPHARRVRHAVVELGPEGTLAGEGRLVLISLADVEPDPECDTVIVQGLRGVDAERLTTYDRAELDRDDEAGLLRRIGVKAIIDAASRERAEPAAPPSDSAVNAERSTET
jgi:PRC-barrel domain protein